MKKNNLLLLVIFSICAFAATNSAFGFSVIKPAANDEAPSVSTALKYIKASEFVKLSAKEYTALTGVKLNFLQRLSFKATKMKMKHDLKSNPDLKVTDYVHASGRTFQIDILWLLIGTILGPIGVLIAYVAKVEQYKLTSAWIGLGLFVVILLLLGKSIFG